jgi:2-C-methyl-D-erythritol 2,4-cyclodiphosphate synthase
MGKAIMDLRIGLGYDFHQLTKGRNLVLGGLRIPFHSGLKGHSDADVVLHALCDALLGAAGLSDIGTQFPDTDPRYKGIESSSLLRQVLEMVKKSGFSPVNFDVVILAEHPTLGPHVDAMREILSDLTQVEGSRIGIKATTMEGCGPVGRGEGIAAQAVVLLKPVLQTSVSPKEASI